MEANKRSFVLRRGNIIFLVLMVVLSLLINEDTRTNLPIVAFLALNTFYLVAFAAIVLPIIRIFKKYHRFRSFIWLFINPIVAFFLVLSFLPPPVQRTDESRVSFAREDITCPFAVIDRNADDFPLEQQKESYIEETIYHDFGVTGNTKERVWDAINKCIPEKTEEGVSSLSSHDISGIASPTVGWFAETEFQLKSSECKPTWVGIHIYTDIYMPKLSASRSSFQSEWDTFIKNLQIHEDGHRDIAVEGAKKIKDALMTMTAPDCDMLVKNMAQKFDELMEEIRRKESTYDAKTNHGAKQGVMF